MLLEHDEGLHCRGTSGIILVTDAMVAFVPSFLSFPVR